MNILIFASERNYRTAPSTFYYLVGSIQNIIVLAVNLGSRVASDGFVVELSGTSNTWCKIKRFCNATFGTTSLYYACLATIDQFFVTAASARLRNWSNIRWAHRITIVSTIFWFLYNIPWLMFANISPVNDMCLYTNKIFAAFASLYLVIVLSFMTSIILVTFGWLAYRNLQRTTVLAEQGAQRQLTKMICVQVILIVISLTPYGLNSLYSWCTSNISKSPNRLNIEYLVSSLIGLLLYVNYAVRLIDYSMIIHIFFFCFFQGSFYVFLIVSNRFRRTVRDRIFWWRVRNRTMPSQQT
jgi:hypothetical protein